MDFTRDLRANLVGERQLELKRRQLASKLLSRQELSDYLDLCEEYPRLGREERLSYASPQQRAAYDKLEELSQLPIEDLEQMISGARGE